MVCGLWFIKIETLYLSGVDVFRLNFSHGLFEEKHQQFKYVKQIEEKYKKPIAVLADLPGPKLRLGSFDPDEVILQQGQEFVLDAATGGATGGPHRGPLQQKEVLRALHVGDKILIDDGKVRLRVVELSPLLQQQQQQQEEEKEEDEKDLFVRCIVEIGGPISSKKGVTVPNVLLPISALTNRDREIALMVSSWGVDFIAVSFVQRASDLHALRALLQGAPSHPEGVLYPEGRGPHEGAPPRSPLLIAKIEKEQALNNLKEIAAAADGLMVARGDLGLELMPEAIPGAQKEIIETAHTAGIPVIVATQMLETMMINPLPSRAEAADVAAAVYDGADAVMLSGETAATPRGPLIVKMQQSIIKQTERDNRFWCINTLRSPEAATAFAAAAAVAAPFSGGPSLTQGPKRGGGPRRTQDGCKDGGKEGPPSEGPLVAEALARGANLMSRVLSAKAILSKSKGGIGASLLSSLRPRAPIIAPTEDPWIARKLQLYWGVQPLFLGAPKGGAPNEEGVPNQEGGAPKQEGAPSNEGWIEIAKREARLAGFVNDPSDLLVVAGPEGEGGPHGGPPKDAAAAQTLRVCTAGSSD